MLCGSTSRAQSIATACHRCLDVAPGEIESEPLSHLLAVSHSAATLDPRRSPKTSPNHTAAGAVKPHQKLMLLQEEARRAHVAAKQLQHKHNDNLLRGGAAEKVGHEGPTDGRPAYASRSPRSVRAHSHNRASTPPRCRGQYVRAGEEDPACLVCGGILKSDTISFGQSLVPEVIERALRVSEECEVMLAVGSTLSVFPAANCVPRARAAGARVVIVNGQESSGVTVQQVVGVALEDQDLTASGAADTLTKVRFL